MSPAWFTVVALFVLTVVFKAAGPLTVGGRALPERAGGVIALVAPALLAALVVYESLVAADGQIEPDARLLGVGIAAGAVAARAPLVVVIAVAAGATAVARVIM